MSVKREQERERWRECDCYVLLLLKFKLKTTLRQRVLPDITNVNANNKCAPKLSWLRIKIARKVNFQTRDMNYILVAFD